MLTQNTFYSSLKTGLDFIVNEDASNPDLDNRNYTYRVNFPNEYKSEIYIKKFEKDYRGD